MFLPKVSVLYSNNNLLADVSVIDGIAGIVVTVDDVALVGSINKVLSLEEAEEAGFTEADEPFAHRHIKEFFA
jgi:hypothetical protein